LARFLAGKLKFFIVIKRILILEAHKDQARTIAEFLKKDKNYSIDYETADYRNDYNGYDIVIPTSANSTYKYVKQHGDIQLGQILYSHKNLITFDKIKTLEIVKNIGIPIPATYTRKEDLNFFPIFYKSLREEGYARRGIIKTPDELANFRYTDVFFQEFIWTKGTYSVAFLADRGKMLHHFSQKEILSYPYHGGSGVVLQKFNDPRLKIHTKNIIKALNYSGWGLIEYKYCRRRRDYVFMEVNAKFWASLKFAFLNEPAFMKLLFNIDMKKRNIKNCIYLDRLILSDWPEIKIGLPYLFKAKWIKSQPIIETIKKRITGRHRIEQPNIKLLPII